MQSYESLQAWQSAFQLTKEVYKLTNLFPSDEKFALVQQLRRAAVSIPSNIAEGYYRKNRSEFKQFCYIAYGSGAEVETQIKLAKELQYADKEHFEIIEPLLDRTLRLLNGLCRSIK